MKKNILELTQTPNPSNNTDKSGAGQLKNEAYKYVCALLNSGGGKLRLKTTMTRDQIIKPIEENAQKYLGTDVTKYLSVCSFPDVEEHVVSIKGHNSLCTINCNAFVPMVTQILQISDRERMRTILDVKRVVEDSDELQNGPAKFFSNQAINLQESKKVQFKLLEGKPEGKKNFAERLRNNRLTNYVSAFANHCGGRIYCGVKDDGKVKGQIVEEEDREKIVSLIDHYIKEMLWPKNIGQPTRGAEGQWDISFEPVLDTNDEPIKSTYVVILTINNCPGGVFTKDPESYHVVDGEVKKIEFDEWRRRIHISNWMCKGMPLCEWSSKELRNKCDRLDGEMLRMINNGRESQFKKFVNNSDLKTPEILMVVLSKWCTYYYRRKQFEDAEFYLKALEACLSKADDSFIFDAKRALVLSSMLRSKIKHEESFKVAKELLTKIERIAPCLLTAEFYIQFATMFTINVKQLYIKLPPGRSYKDEITSFYNKAIQHLQEIDYAPQSRIDRLQKAYIHLAICKLGWSLSDVIEESVSDKDLNEARTCLKRVIKLNTEDHPMSGFRHCHFDFAHAFLLYRKAQLKKSRDKRLDRLESAIKEVTRVKRFAEKRHFEELSAYARRHLQLFENELNKPQ